jgi:IMP dehydrogenase
LIKRHPCRIDNSEGHREGVKYPNACKDKLGRLRVGAAIGVGADREERTEALLAAGVDVLTIDTAHGHTKGVIDAVIATKKAFPKCQLIAGNIATGEARGYKGGADAVKVGWDRTPFT